jgi:acyl transferase domain-containing protein/phosphopantetheinyl transferase
MACIFPKAPDLNAYWRNILEGVCAITEARPEHWDTELYYDPEATGTERVICKHGGFLTEQERRFRPIDYGIMPRSVEGGEPDHFLALRAAYEALDDAGYLRDPKARSRTGIVLGKGNYINAGNMSLIQHGWVVEQTLKILKKLHPGYTDETLEEVKQELKASLPPFDTEVVPSLIPNVMTGRIANRLDIQGPNYTVDAACASSLVAVDITLRELASGRFDLGLVGGVQGGNTLLSYLLFSPLKALSTSGALRAFDKQADGTILGEGIGLVVLKRREDAERDGDAVYALIKGVGVSSDGKGAGLLAPRKEGALLALRRAYEDAGVVPESIELMEAHGTGTIVGDATEIQAIQDAFGQRPGAFAPCALGSVKSMVGHLLPAAGAAGLIKATLALHHKVLPPTVHCEEPNPCLDQERGFFYVNTKARPWIHGSQDYPRRAGVSAFGFGGINAHVVLEEYPDPEEAGQAHLLDWDSELILLEAGERRELIEKCDQLAEYVRRCPEMDLRHLAYTLFTRTRFHGPCLSLVARSTEDLLGKLSRARERLADTNRRQIKDRKGIYYFDAPLDERGRLVFLFPGEGAQYPDMLADLCIHFASVRQCFDRADASFLRQGKPYVPSDAVFPRAAFRSEDREGAQKLLWQIDVAVEAVLTANQALYGLLTDLGLEPAAMLGHSSGEYSTLLASGILQGVSDDLVIETNRVIESMEKSGRIPEAVMIAAGTDRSLVERIIEEQDLEPMFIAMDNCPHQVVLVGTEGPAEKLVAALQEHRVLCEPLSFRRGYHTPLFEPVSERLREVFRKYPIQSPRVAAWSCTLKGPYPEDTEAVRALLADHWVEPVHFRETVCRLYEEGYRTFVEVGPRGNLTAFVEDTLRGRPHLALPSNLPRRSGLEQIHHLLGILAAQRVPLDLLPLYERRHPAQLTLDANVDRERFGLQKGEGLTLSMGLPRMDVQGAATLPTGSAKLPKQEAPQEGARPVAASCDPVTPPSRSALDPVAMENMLEGLPAAAGGDGSPTADRMLEGYFQNMETFLQVQQEVMEAYLRGSPARPTHTAAGVFESTVEGEEPDKPHDAATTGDNHLPSSPESAPSSAETATPQKDPVGGPDEIAERILELVSRKTGYPARMLDLDLDMEAELGIDSIKRVEILGLYQARYSGEPEINLEEATRHKTLGSLIAYLQESYARTRDAPGTAEPAPEPHLPSDRPLPLVGEIVSQDENRIRCRRLFSFSEDSYLHDHVLSGPISTLDPDRRGLAVVPLTLSMEMMAEVASLLVPGKVVVGMRDIRTHRWIPVNEKGFAVETEARRTSKGEESQEVEVQVWEAAGDPSTRQAAGTPILTAVVLFDACYPPPPEASRFSLKGERPSRWDPDRLYPEGMFHGPAFQAVKSVDRWGEDGATATFEILPFDRLFRGRPAPGFLVDPLILDAAGQLVGFWTTEHLETGFIVFPYRCDELRLYGPPRPAGTKVACRANIQLFGHLQVRSDIDLLTPEETPWMSLRGWEDKRFDLPVPFYRFWKDPIRAGMSEDWEPSLLASHMPVPGAARSLDNPLGRADGIWKSVWAHMVLGHEERTAFEALSGNEEGQLEWLLGRTAAKDAFRALAERQLGVRLGPGDIELSQGRSGRTQFKGPWQQDPRLKALQPAVCLSHSNGRVLAWVAAAPDGQACGMGIDLAQIPAQEGSLDALPLSDDEVRLLNEMDPSKRQEWALRFRCAKKSLAKALGAASTIEPNGIDILGWGSPAGTLLASPAREDDFRAWINPSYPAVVHTVREKDWIVAWTWIAMQENKDGSTAQRTALQ